MEQAPSLVCGAWVQSSNPTYPSPLCTIYVTPPNCCYLRRYVYQLSGFDSEFRAFVWELGGMFVVLKPQRFSQGIDFLRWQL